MTYDHTRGIRAVTLFLGVLAAAILFMAVPGSAAAADNTEAAYDATTAVFGPTISNVPWEYIPAWYKAELTASGYSAPADPSMPPVAPAASSEEVYGPTIANVPWEYVPAWYKAELAADAVNGNSVPSQIAVIADGAPSLNALDEISGIEAAGKNDAAGSGSDAEGSSFERGQWGAQAASGDTSFMSQTSFFFLGVLLIFLILMLVSALKQRSRTPEPGG
jgi:hypothetical protein